MNVEAKILCKLLIYEVITAPPSLATYDLEINSLLTGYFTAVSLLTHCIDFFPQLLGTALS
jgi:hypothetical protein